MRELVSTLESCDTISGIRNFSHETHGEATNESAGRRGVAGRSGAEGRARGCLECSDHIFFIHRAISSSCP